MADPEQSIPVVKVDEKADEQSKPVARDSLDQQRFGSTDSAAAVTQPSSPPLLSPQISPQSPERPRGSRTEEYYASRPTTDRFGNPLPSRRKPSAMSTVYGNSSVRLPGDLGPNDPRRPRSPAIPTLPGDLGPNDPRRPRSRSPAVPTNRPRSGSDASEVAPPEGERVLKDPKILVASPSDDGASEGDPDTDNNNDTDREESKRGRHRKRPEPGRTTSGKSINLVEDSEESDQDKAKFTSGKKPDPTKGESMLSLAKDSTSRTTPPSGKKRVHPSTAFDVAPSGLWTPLDSDQESRSELRAAQKLSLAMSNIHSTPSAHRVIRQIIRGDYAYFQREAEQGRKRQRMYLVATDLSPEAEYALEWTIGTVLRDGDTLFAVYAVDEEAAGSGLSEGGVEIGRGADMVKDTAAVLHRLPTNTVPPSSPGPSPLSKAAQAASPHDRSPSQGGGTFSAAETERRRALEAVSARCIRLLRKTRLQVRVVVEVFHCKSPRHMITELIDFLSPTLVIIGSRGRSAVKGVLLGSFSNYLVTKSSVPVMVARKRLRKHSAAKRNRDGTIVPYSGISMTGRFSNVIEAPKGRGLRVKGWDEVGID